MEFLIGILFNKNMFSPHVCITLANGPIASVTVLTNALKTHYCVDAVSSFVMAKKFDDQTLLCDGHNIFEN